MLSWRNLIQSSIEDLTVHLMIGTDQSSWRAIYAQAADPEALLPAHLATELHDEIRHQIADEEPPGRTDIAELQRAATEWSSCEQARYRRLAGSIGDADRDSAAKVLARRAALSCAPLSRVSGGWLQWLSCSANADDPASLSFLALYATDVGVGHPHASRGTAFLTLLRALHLSDNAVPAARLIRDQRIADRGFYLPAMLLTMSRLPEAMRNELAGADLCLRSVGLLPAFAVVRDVLPAADWAAIDPGAARQPGQPSGLELSQRSVMMLQKAGGDGGLLTSGFLWALAALKRWSDDLLAELEAAQDPAYEMAELLLMRAREGSVYHHDVEIDGKPLAHWLRVACSDPAPLMAALAASRLVEPGCPDESPLVGSLISDRGPMFRVFAPQDLAVIRRWITSLPAQRSAARPVIPVAPTSEHPSPLTLGAFPARDARPASIREAYHLLATRADTPALRLWAGDYVRGWLARSRHGMDHAEMLPPPRWTVAGLRPWLADQHDQHNQEFERDTGPVPARDALVDSTVQLAPLTLIDGSWLQGFTDYELASSEVGHSLFATYWDELGNGEPCLNHPLIYREVLQEMDVHLPPTGSGEFARWPALRDVAFELPVYWLSIGRFPRTFMPEILGLNLAMELSGVGGTYRKAHIALQAHGFSTRFVDIHNTIDNVASGHSAWAADAIDTYMAMLLASHAAEDLAAAWERVRVGYRSLNPPSNRRARAAARRASQAPSLDRWAVAG
jgi:hypothetical protein